MPVPRLGRPFRPFRRSGLVGLVRSCLESHWIDWVGGVSCLGPAWNCVGLAGARSCAGRIGGAVRRCGQIPCAACQSRHPSNGSLP